MLTFEEFELLPEIAGKQELIGGELIGLPPPKFQHSLVAHRLYRRLLSAGDDRAYLEAGYRIGGGWLQPDVSVAHPNHPLRDGYLSGAPQLAVEVLSPSNTASAIERKLTLYFADGAAEVWVIDPTNSCMTVYRQSPTGVTRIAVNERYDSAFGSILLTELFA